MNSDSPGATVPGRYLWGFFTPAGGGSRLPRSLQQVKKRR